MDVVVIKTENGPVRIDKSSYDEKEHVLHVADEHHDEHGVRRDAVQSNLNPSPTTPAAAPVAGTSPGPVAPIAPADPAAPAKQYGVLQNKNRFFVVDAANGGAMVTDVAGIDPKGYASNKEAWDALFLVQSAA